MNRPAAPRVRVRKVAQGQARVPDALAVGVDEAARMCGLSRAGFYRMQRAGDGPLFVQLTPRCRVYPVDELRAWLKRRARATARAQAARADAT